MVEYYPQTDYLENIDSHLDSIILRGKTINYISKDFTISNVLRKGEYWESWMATYFNRFYIPNTNFVDLGGHIGTTTMLMSEFVTDKGKIYTFEPVFNNILLKNVKSNSLENVVTLYPFGLGNKASVIDIPKPNFYVKQNFGGTTFINPAASPTSPKMQITVVPLDDFALDNVSVIKIDVENMEMEVLEGAIELITNCKPTILMATHDLPLFCNSSIFGKLKDLGYCLMEIPEGWHDYLLYIPPVTYIPKEIHICQKDLSQLQLHSNDWTILNPDYKLNLHDDADCRTFLLNEFSQKHLDLFDFLKHGPIKADFWRVCILYKCGGVYVDSDVQPLVPIDIFLEDNVDFFVCTSYGPNYNPNFIMAKPGDEFLKQCIDEYLQMYDSKIEYDYWTYSIMTIFNKLLVLENYKKESGIYYDTRGKKYQIAKEMKAVKFYDDHNIYKGLRICNNRYADYDCFNHQFRI